VQDHGLPACQRHDRFLHPAAPGDLHRPGTGFGCPAMTIAHLLSFRYSDSIVHGRGFCGPISSHWCFQC
jgi:hypothetical protein